MTKQLHSKYGIKMIPRHGKVRPKNVDAINSESTDVLEIAKRVMERHKDTLAALAKRGKVAE